MASKFYKYLPKNDNITDGGFFDDRFVTASRYDDKNYYDLPPLAEKYYRDEFNIPEDYNVADVLFAAVANGERLRYDKKTDTYYFIAEAIGRRTSSKSTIHIVIESNIFNETFDEVIELPAKIEVSHGVVRIIIPTKYISSSEEYWVNIKYKDEKDFEYHTTNKKYKCEEDKYIDFGYGFQNVDAEYDIEYDKNNVVIEYGYEDTTHGDKFELIEDINVYQKNNGVWTSDVVAEPEKYIKSDYAWYYGDERIIQYLVNKNVFTEEQANAIRAANYEDIFSLGYKIKHYGIYLFIVFVIIILIIFVKKLMKSR